MPKGPSPLMTAAEVAQVWNLTPRTVKARLKPTSTKRNPVAPLSDFPDLRWDRQQVYDHLDRARQQRSSVIALIHGRERRRA